jgi:phenylpyruvate tautomerase PptA (4-oxalocrotonate tautomerase family)
MPLVRISLLEGKSTQHKQSIADGVHRAMVEALAVPSDDRFQIITEHRKEDLIYDAGYLGVERSDDIVVIQIILGSWRNAEQKKALYRAIAATLAQDPGLRIQDVLITLVENERIDWSFGNGEAQYVK